MVWLLVFEGIKFSEILLGFLIIYEVLYTIRGVQGVIFAADARKSTWISINPLQLANNHLWICCPGDNPLVHYKFKIRKYHSAMQVLNHPIREGYGRDGHIYIIICVAMQNI